MDPDKVTDKGLEELEKRLAREYKDATKYMREKLADALASFKEEDKEQRAKLANKEINKAQYQKWVNSQVASQKSMQDLIKVLTTDMTNANKIAIQMMNQEMPSVYAMNANYGVYQVDSMYGLNVSGSFSMYNPDSIQKVIQDTDDVIPAARQDIPKDQRWNRSKISSALIQGLLTGDSIEKIADRLEDVAVMNRNAAIRNARTLTTAAQNSGRMLGYRRAQEMGVELKQRWMATVDMRTRPTHALMDGETVELGEKFSNGLRYPGDPKGRPEEFYNCRCKLASADPLFEEGDRERRKDLSQRFSRLPKDMTYDQWQAKKLEEAMNKSKDLSEAPAEGKAKRPTPAYRLVTGPSSLESSMSKKAFSEFKAELKNAPEPIKKLYNAYATDDKYVNLGVQKNASSTSCFQPITKVVYYELGQDTPSSDSKLKFATLHHENGHKFDDIIGINADFLTFDTYDTLTEAGRTKFTRSVASSSDSFLEAMRKDKEVVYSAIASPYWDNIKDKMAWNARSAGVQDFMSGFMTSEQRKKLKAGVMYCHTDEYYDRVYNKFTNKESLKRELKGTEYEDYDDEDLRMAFREFETASELWANIISALTCGGEDEKWMRQFCPNSVAECEKICGQYMRERDERIKNST